MVDYTVLPGKIWHSIKNSLCVFLAYASQVFGKEIILSLSGSQKIGKQNKNLDRLEELNYMDSSNIAGL